MGVATTRSAVTSKASRVLCAQGARKASMKGSGLGGSNSSSYCYALQATEVEVVEPSSQIVRKASQGFIELERTLRQQLRRSDHRAVVVRRVGPCSFISSLPGAVVGSRELEPGRPVWYLARR